MWALISLLLVVCGITATNPVLANPVLPLPAVGPGEHCETSLKMWVMAENPWQLEVEVDPGDNWDWEVDAPLTESGELAPTAPTGSWFQVTLVNQPLWIPSGTYRYSLDILSSAKAFLIMVHNERGQFVYGGNDSFWLHTADQVASLSPGQWIPTSPDTTIMWEDIVIHPTTIAGQGQVVQGEGIKWISQPFSLQGGQAQKVALRLDYQGEGSLKLITGPGIQGVNNWRVEGKPVSLIREQDCWLLPIPEVPPGLIAIEGEITGDFYWESTATWISATYLGENARLAGVIDRGWLGDHGWLHIQGEPGELVLLSTGKRLSLSSKGVGKIQLPQGLYWLQSLTANTAPYWVKVRTNQTSYVSIQGGEESPARGGSYLSVAFQPELSFQWYKERPEVSVRWDQSGLKLGGVRSNLSWEYNSSAIKEISILFTDPKLCSPWQSGPFRVSFDGKVPKLSLLYSKAHGGIYTDFATSSLWVRLAGCRWEVKYADSSLGFGVSCPPVLSRLYLKENKLTARGKLGNIRWGIDMDYLERAKLTLDVSDHCEMFVAATPQIAGGLRVHRKWNCSVGYLQGSLVGKLEQGSSVLESSASWSMKVARGIEVTLQAINITSIAGSKWASSIDLELSPKGYGYFSAGYHSALGFSWKLGLNIPI